MEIGFSLEIGVEEQKDSIDNLKLYKAVIKGDWEATKKAIDNDPSLITTGINYLKETPLHLAVRRGASQQYIENLVEMMSESDLEILDEDGNTALHCAGSVGNTEAAMILVKKNKRLTGLRGSNNQIPLYWAAEYSHEDTTWYLWSATSREHPCLLTGDTGAVLLKSLIIAEFYDIALNLLKLHPSLAIEKDDEGFTPLYRLAQKPSAFLSGSQFVRHPGWWIRFVSMLKLNAHHGEDIENPAASPEHSRQENWRPMRQFGLMSICEAMLKQKHALQLAKMLCAEIVKSRTCMENELLTIPISTAVRLGIPELVLEIIKVFPDVIWTRDRDGRCIFHQAILFRKGEVYKLLRPMIRGNGYAMSYIDNSGNNILHLAGKLGPSNRISGPAFQMQRELQWFKEVESVVRQSYKKMKNKDGKTPREVFTEEHKELVIKGEKWMKTTATSCTVVAALVTTVVFAGVYTSPGGNNSEGYPILMKSMSFIIFISFNSLALFASSASVLIFLGILASPYSEEDFLLALPLMLRFGVSTLVVSISFMMVAFISSLGLTLGLRFKWIAISIALLLYILISLFQLTLFPLQVRTRFEPNIFRRAGNQTISNMLGCMVQRVSLR